MNSLLLELKMKQAGISVEQASNQTNMDPATFYRKKVGESDFKRKEIQVLRKTLNLTSEEVDAIFFDD